MDVNGVNNIDDEHEDDTVGSIDDVSVGNIGELNGDSEEINGNVPEPVAYPVKNTDGTPSKPLLKDPITGKFIKGTGGSMRGGRPVGSRDKITDTMIRLAEDTAAEHGQEMFEKLARTDPAACLALITRLLPNADLSKAIEGESEADNAITQVSINLVAAPSPRRIEGRTQQQIEERQRGLEAPVERIQAPSEDAVVATQVDPDEEAARAERERQERQRDAIKAHGGLTGRATRRSAPDTIDYPDDDTTI